MSGKATKMKQFFLVMKTAQFMMQSFDPIKSKALHTNRDIGKTHIKIHCNAAIVK